MNLSIRAEDIMTPRRRLLNAMTDDEANQVAQENGFDAVPFINSDGSVREYWSKDANRRLPITRRHRTLYDEPVERLLKVLGAHVIQFVFYRSEMVGLIDASDLNKPRACLAWLEPMLELERAILNAVVERKIDESKQFKALGRDAKVTLKRQRAAKKHDLHLPLLQYAQFPHLLNAARNLGLIDLSNDEQRELNIFRIGAAHGGGSVIKVRSDCERLAKALADARKSAKGVSS